MDSADTDGLAVRLQLDERGWIPRKAEAFRHLPPPAIDVWLGSEAVPPAPGRDAHPPAGAGWTLHPIGQRPQGRIDARWLDAGDALQRAEMWAGLPAPVDQGAGDAGDGGAIDGDAVDGDAAPFAWAHRALCRQALSLRIAGTPGADRGPSETVWLQLRHQPRSAVEAPLLLIEVLAGVHCVLVETHDTQPVASQQAIVQNLQVRLLLGEGATLQHLRIAKPGAADRIAHHLHARLGRGSHYAQALVASGSGYHLQRSMIELHAERAVAHSAGLLLAADSVLEHQVRISHGAAQTTSAIEDLALASGSARAVVNAHTRIAPGAARADVRQRLNGIPTGGQPKLVLRPHLEIHHDQVQASHGATWGALSDDALFYARQRGLDERSARGLIVHGMAGALLRRCFTDDPLLEALDIDELLRAAVARHLAPGEDASHG